MNEIIKNIEELTLLEKPESAQGYIMTGMKPYIKEKDIKDNVISLSQEAYDEYRSKPHEKPNWEAMQNKQMAEFGKKLRALSDAVMQEVRHPDLEDWQETSLSNFMHNSTLQAFSIQFGGFPFTHDQHFDLTLLQEYVLGFYSKHPKLFTKEREEFIFKQCALIMQNEPIDHTVDYLFIFEEAE